jgi:hypothetical protein
MLCVTPISMNAMTAMERIHVLDNNWHFEVSGVLAEPSQLLNFDDYPVKLGSI